MKDRLKQVALVKHPERSNLMENVNRSQGGSVSKPTRIKGMNKLISKKREAGFSLLEATIAIVVLLIVLLSVFSVFTYSVVYNTGNNTRSQALSILQREIELVRSYKFTPTVTDTELTGGTKAAKFVSSADGTNFRVEVIIDDDPLTTGLQTDATKTIKDITITVTPTNKVESWKTVIASTVTLRRVRGN